MKTDVTEDASPSSVDSHIDCEIYAIRRAIALSVFLFGVCLNLLLILRFLWVGCAGITIGYCPFVGAALMAIGLFLHPGDGDGKTIRDGASYSSRCRFLSLLHAGFSPFWAWYLQMFGGGAPLMAYYFSVIMLDGMVILLLLSALCRCIQQKKEERHCLTYSRRWLRMPNLFVCSIRLNQIYAILMVLSALFFAVVSKCDGEEVRFFDLWYSFLESRWSIETLCAVLLFGLFVLFGYGVKAIGSLYQGVNQHEH